MSNASPSLKSMRVNTWPPHAELGSKRRTDFKNIRPAVADAMKSQGMESLKHLADRVKWITAQDSIQAVFGELTIGANDISSIISKNNPEVERIYSADGHGYTAASRLVAMALGSDEQDLFGPNPRSGIDFEGIDTLAAVWPSDILASDMTSAYEKLVFEDLARLLDRAMEHLTPLEERLLRLRLALAQGQSEELVLEEIGTQFYCTGEAVRQKVNKAFDKLRHPSVVEPLERFDRDYQTAWERNAVAQYREKSGLVQRPNSLRRTGETYGRPLRYEPAYDADGNLYDMSLER